MFDWSLNPYMGCAHRCTFCYVRAYELRADRPSDDGYGRSIRVKVNIADVLRRELARPSWTGDTVAIGAATDPYQPAEGRFRLTRGCLEALRDAGNPFSLITRSPQIVRDLDVLAEAAGRADVAVVFSVPTLDEEVWRRTEPGTPHPRERMKVVAALNRAGIACSVLMAPVLPGISDHPRMLRDVAAAAIEAGAPHISPILLHLRPGVREGFEAWLGGAYPELVDRYRELYPGSYGSPAARKELAGRVASIVRSLGGTRPATGPDSRWSRPDPAPPRGASPRQLTLV